jgi:hypothetical protein
MIHCSTGINQSGIVDLPEEPHTVQMLTKAENIQRSSSFALSTSLSADDIF